MCLVSKLVTKLSSLSVLSGLPVKQQKRHLIVSIAYPLKEIRIDFTALQFAFHH